MLQAIRDKAQGWIAWVIVILISVPFALWGIQEYLGVGGEKEVAEVAGQPITEQALEEQARQARENLRQNLGEAYRADMFPETMLRAQALDQMINERVVQQAVADWRMRASDQMVLDAIHREPAFQTNGRFDADLYKVVLKNNALSQTAYDESVRHALTLQQLEQGVSGTAFATSQQVDRYQALMNQQRTVSYAIIKADGFKAQITPADADIETYYQEHPQRFQVPERVKLDYILLDVASLAKQIKADPAAVQDWYAQHKDQFVAPEERHLRHILITVSGDEAAAEAKAQALRKQLADGADFAALAKTESADPGSAAKGGDLGWVSHGMMVDAFEKAAFALKPGEISQPVKSPFGYHIIQLEGVRGGGDATFDQIADKVTAAYKKAEAERLFFERAERLAELAYESPDNLDGPADALGLEIRHSDWITRQGASGDLSSPKVTRAAFSDEVLTQGHNSDLLELGPEKLVVVRVAEHQQARQRPLDEVRDQVVTAVRAEKASDAAVSAGEALLTEVRSAAALQAAASDKGWQWHADAVIKRSDSQVPAAVRDEAFGLSRPAADGASLAGTVLATGDYAVVALTAVENGKPLPADDPGRKLLEARLASLSGSLDTDSLIKDLRDRADITVTLPAKAPAGDE